MIKELTELQGEQAEEVLSEVASRLLPNPENGTEEPHEGSGFARGVVAAVSEYIAQRGPKARYEVLDYVSNRLSDLYLTGEETKEVRNRLGDRGELEATQATIEYGQDLENLAPFTLLKPSDIKAALITPDLTERISGEDFEFKKGSFPVVSLRVTRHRLYSAHAYSVLLICVHEADKITVWQALRIYDADVGVLIDTQPLGILRAFVEKYGLPLQVEGVETGRKFILTETFPRRNHLPVIESRPSPGEVTGSISFVRVSEAETVSVAFAYCYRLDQYVQDLARHGLPVKLTARDKDRIKGTVLVHPRKLK